MKWQIFGVIFLVILEITSAARILFLFPSPSKSHLLVVQGLSTTLAERGHDVTVVSPFLLSKPMKNYRDIQSPISDDDEELKSDMVKNPSHSILTRFPKLISIVEEMALKMMDMPEYKRILREEKFDLVVVGMFFNNYLLALGDHFKCPTMMLSVGGGVSFLKTVIGNPLGVSGVPHLLSGLTGKMNFLERVKNFLVYSVEIPLSFYMHHVQRQFFK